MRSEHPLQLQQASQATGLLGAEQPVLGAEGKALTGATAPSGQDFSPRLCRVGRWQQFPGLPKERFCPLGFVLIQEQTPFNKKDFAFQKNKSVAGTSDT